jgi:hypothetical protein
LLHGPGITGIHSGIEGLVIADGGRVDGQPPQQLPKNSKFMSGFRGFILENLR